MPRFDNRGYLERTFEPGEFAAIGWEGQIQQINHTKTLISGAIRGMHYQLSPWTEWKCVSCIVGKIFDVVVDIRNNSPTFLKWYGVELSPESFCSLIIPPGFAHGYQCLTHNVEMIYFHSQPFIEKAGAGLNPFDPILSINWPNNCSQISEGDSKSPLINQNFLGV